MATSKAAVHWVMFSPRREPVKCYKTAKAVDKAKADASKLDGYEVREVAVGRCPFCNPKPKEETGHAPEVVTLSEPVDTPEIRPGQCHDCKESRAGQYTLAFIERHLVRMCKDCGAIFDLETSKPWEGLTS